MHFELIQRWNAVVQPFDHVWHLGDFAFRNKSGEVEPIFDALNGIKHFVIGNHDDKHVLRLPWASQQAYKELKLDGLHIVLSHYAIVSWNRAHHGSIHLHGHHHGSLKQNCLPFSDRRIDVGVDCWNFTPVSFEQIKASLGTNNRTNSQ